jgi:hypothetical protein
MVRAKKTDSTLSRPQFPHPFLEDWIGADFGGLAFDPSLLTEAKSLDRSHRRKSNASTKSLDKKRRQLKITLRATKHHGCASHEPTDRERCFILWCATSVPPGIGHCSQRCWRLCPVPSGRQSVDLQGGGSCTGEKGQIREKRDGRIRKGGGGRQATWETASGVAWCRGGRRSSGGDELLLWNPLSSLGKGCVASTTWPRATAWSPWPPTYQKELVTRGKHAVRQRHDGHVLRASWAKYRKFDPSNDNESTSREHRPVMPQIISFTTGYLNSIKKLINPYYYMTPKT